MKLTEEQIENIYHRFPHYRKIVVDNNMVSIFETIMEEAYSQGYTAGAKDTINLY